MHFPTPADAHTKKVTLPCSATTPPEVRDDGTGARDHALYADQGVYVLWVQVTDRARPVQVVHPDLHPPAYPH